MRFLTVNLRSGGSRASIEALIGRCLQHRPDILVFAEFRHNKSTGNALRRRLATEGFVHQAEEQLQEYRADWEGTALN